MRQVTQTVAIVGLFLLTFSKSAKLNNHSEESKEIGRIESNIEASMGNMEKHFEEGNGIDGEQSRVISKAFVKLGDFIKKKTEHNRKSNSQWILLTYKYSLTMTALLLIYFCLLLLISKHIQGKSSSEENNSFNIKTGGNAHVRFSYELPKGRRHSTFTGKKKKDAEYFLNFVFNNYRNPKKSLDRKTLSKKVKMRRTRTRLLPNGMPNPYKYFPLKGEDM
nr:uncharacterized protein LOC108020588 [Drosophila suzukii]